MSLLLAALGLAAVAYGITVMMVNSGTGFFAVWYALGALLLLAAWATHAGWWEALPVLLRRAGLAVLAVLLVAFGLTQVLIAGQFGERGENGLDYVIVLGAQVRDGGVPSMVLQYRLDAARDYLAENPRTRCIVSGGQGPNEPMAEADAMAAYLEACGINPARIIRESESLNTRQNIVNSMSLLDSPDARVGIVTNDFHLFRALRIAQKAGLGNACGIAAYSQPWYLPNNMLRESMGLVKDLAVGNI